MRSLQVASVPPGAESHHSGVASVSIPFCLCPSDASSRDRGRGRPAAIASFASVSFSDGNNGDVVLVTLHVDAPHDRVAGRSLEYSVACTTFTDRIVDEAHGAAAIPRVTLPVDVGVIAAIHLPPGLSTIKAAVRIGNDLTGSVSLNVDVPRLNEPLTMSDIELAPMSEHALVFGNPPACIKRHLPKPVSTERTFDMGDTLAIYGEVYASRRSSRVTALVTIRNEADQIERRVA